MLKKIVSVLLLSVILVSSFGLIVSADEDIYPYSDTSITQISREEFFADYAPSLGIPLNRINIPEDDYIFLVRNEFGDYGELIRDFETGRLLRIYELSITLDNDVEVDYNTMNKIGFLNNPMNLSLSRPKFNPIGTNITGFFTVNGKEDDCYPTVNMSCNEPIVTEFFLFTKSDNFSAILSGTCDIIYTRGVGVPSSELYASLISESYDYIKPLRMMVEGTDADYITVGEGNATNMVTYEDSEGNILWETFVPVGLRAPKVLLKFDEILKPGAKYVFSKWKGHTNSVVSEDMTFTAEYVIVPDSRGDLNEDGIVNTKDVVMLLKMLKNGGAGLSKERADINLDGAVDYEDVTHFLEAFSEAREW